MNHYLPFTENWYFISNRLMSCSCFLTSNLRAINKELKISRSQLLTYSFNILLYLWSRTFSSWRTITMNNNCLHFSCWKKQTSLVVTHNVIHSYCCGYLTSSHLSSENGLVFIWILLWRARYVAVVYILSVLFLIEFSPSSRFSERFDG